MVQVGIGHSTRWDTARASAEAAAQAMRQSGAERSDLTILFATPGHAERYAEMVRLVSDVTRARSLVGCSGLGVMSTLGEVEASAGLVVMTISGAGVQAAPFLVRDLARDPREAGREVGRLVKGSLTPDSLLLLFPDALPLEGGAFFDGIQEQAGHVPAVGAGSAGDPGAGGAFQFCGGDAASGAVAGVLLNSPLRASTEVTQACQPIGAARTVTRSEGNRVLELDGRRAIDAVAELLGPLLGGDLEAAARFLFAGLPVAPEQREFGRGDYLVRPVLGLEMATGALLLPQPVRQGECMRVLLREAEGARQDLKAMLDAQALNHHGRTARLGFYFNCCARGTSLYRIPEIDLHYIKYVFGEMPLIGFFGNSEIAPARGRNVLHQHTGVLTLLSEPSQEN
jgi:small ligand-binding sensory domain FIST